MLAALDNPLGRSFGCFCPPPWKLYPALPSPLEARRPIEHRALGLIQLLGEPGSSPAGWPLGSSAAPSLALLYTLVITLLPLIFVLHQASLLG